MNDKIEKLVCGIASLVQLGAIVGLVGIGLKRNNDCYKAECKLIDAEFKLLEAEVDNMVKDHEIEDLKTEIKQLKSETTEES